METLSSELVLLLSCGLSCSGTWVARGQALPVKTEARKTLSLQPFPVAWHQLPCPLSGGPTLPFPLPMVRLQKPLAASLLPCLLQAQLGFAFLDTIPLHPGSVSGFPSKQPGPAAAFRRVVWWLNSIRSFTSVPAGLCHTCVTFCALA